MLLSSSSSDITGDLLERERQFSSVREDGWGSRGGGTEVVEVGSTADGGDGRARVSPQ